MSKTGFTLLLAMLIGCCTESSAQKITIGAKGGFSFSNFSSAGGDNNSYAGLSTLIKPSYGLYGEYHFTHLFSVSLGMAFSSMGCGKNDLQAVPLSFFSATQQQELASYNITKLYADFGNEIRLNYLSIPVLARINLPLSNAISFYAGAGPVFSFLMSAHHITSGSDYLYSDEAGSVEFGDFAWDFDGNQNIKSSFRNLNIGVEALAGFSLKINQHNAIFLETSANYGMTAIQKDAADGKNRTHAVAVHLGYAYSF